MKKNRNKKKNILFKSNIQFVLGTFYIIADKTGARVILAQSNLNWNPTRGLDLSKMVPNSKCRVQTRAISIQYISFFFGRCAFTSKWYFLRPPASSNQAGAVCKSGDGRGLLSKYHCVSNFDATQKENPRIIVKEKSK